jgi:hypothetical protein
MTPTRSRASRRLTLLDAMIAVAALAVWLVATRSYAERSNLGSIWYLRDYGLPRILQKQGAYLLMASSIAMLVIRLRPPRPPHRRLWRQPGLAASAGAAIGMAVGLLGFLAASTATVDPPLVDFSAWLSAARPFAAPGVAGAWLGLFLTGRWKSEPGSIDRLGLLLGVLWLIQFVIAEMPTNRWIIIIDNLIRRGFR